MAGIRITHPTVRNARFNVTQSSVPYQVPYTCTSPEFGGCGGTHLFKTHHLNVDETGSVIVGDELYKKIKRELDAAGFVWANVVKKPPTLGIGLAPQVEGRGAWGNIPIIEGKGL